MRKKYLMTAAFFATAVLFAGETLAPQKAADWLGSNSSVTANGNVFITTGRNDVFSRSFIPVDTAKKYRVSGEFRTAAGSIPATFNFGIVPLDAARRVIKPVNGIVYPGSETELAAACRIGDMQLTVKANRNWRPHKHFHVAFESDNSGKYSDLPNYKVTGGSLEKAESGSDGAVFTLTKPLEYAYPAGTAVRLQCDGGTYLCAAGEDLEAPGDWKEFSGEITGMTTGHTRNQFRAGSRYAKIIIGNRNSEAALEFRNVKLEEVEPKQ